MNTTTQNTHPTSTANTPTVGARIRHPRIAYTIEECQLMLTAGSSADLILVCGPTGVGKSTLGHFLVEEELKRQADEMENNPGFMPAIRVEAPASGEKEFSWRLFYQRILHELEGELDAPRTAYGVDPETGKVVRHAATIPTACPGCAQPLSARCAIVEPVLSSSTRRPTSSINARLRGWPSSWIR